MLHTVKRGGGTAMSQYEVVRDSAILRNGNKNGNESCNKHAPWLDAARPQALENDDPGAQVNIRKLAVVSAIGSDMDVPGMRTTIASALSSANISVLAVHQSIRQANRQSFIDEDDYDLAIRSLHRCLAEIHDHDEAICAA